MRIALTGAERDPGRHILSELQRHDIQVIQLDAAAEGVLHNVAALSAALAGVSHVVHVGAPIVPTDAGGDIEATTTLLDACRRLELEGFIYVSTTETYGLRLPPWPVTERWVPEPVGTAQQAQVAAERAARTYRQRVPLIVVRAAPCLSADGGLLHTLVNHCLAHPRGALIGGGDAPLSIIAAADLGRAVWALIEHAGALRDRVFHATSAHTTWGELAREACRLRGVEPRFWHAPPLLAQALEKVNLAEWALPAPPELRDYIQLTARPHLIDDSSLRVAVGYEPVYGVRAALKRALDPED